MLSRLLALLVALVTYAPASCEHGTTVSPAKMLSARQGSKQLVARRRRHRPTQPDGVNTDSRRQRTKSLFGVVPRLSSTLVSPSLALPYNLSTFDRGRFAQLEQGVVGASQFAQDLWIDAALGSMRGGLVVESGAFDGESFSNSLLFEVGRGWRCLLVEANPSLQVQIEAVHRRCHLLKGGLSTTAHESTFDFVMAGAVGGLADSIDTKKVLESQKIYKNIAGGTVSVPCYPLHRVLAHMAQQEAKAQSAQLTAPRASVGGGRFTVDFWSLDTEGSECAPRLAPALAPAPAPAPAPALSPALALSLALALTLTGRPSSTRPTSRPSRWAYSWWSTTIMRRSAPQC